MGLQSLLKIEQQQNANAEREKAIIATTFSCNHTSFSSGSSSQASTSCLLLEYLLRI